MHNETIKSNYMCDHVYTCNNVWCRICASMHINVDRKKLKIWLKAFLFDFLTIQGEKNIGFYTLGILFVFEKQNDRGCATDNIYQSRFYVFLLQKVTNRLELIN